MGNKKKGGNNKPVITPLRKNCNKNNKLINFFDF